MSLRALAWAMGQRLPAVRKMVLLAIANQVARDGSAARVYVDTLAVDAGLSERTVRSALGELERAGLLYRWERVGRAGQAASAYVLNLDGRRGEEWQRQVEAVQAVEASEGWLLHRADVDGGARPRRSARQGPRQRPLPLGGAGGAGGGRSRAAGGAELAQLTTELGLYMGVDAARSLLRSARLSRAEDPERWCLWAPAPGVAWLRRWQTVLERAAAALHGPLTIEVRELEKAGDRALPAG